MSAQLKKKLVANSNSDFLWDKSSNNCCPAKPRTVTRNPSELTLRGRDVYVCRWRRLREAKKVGSPRSGNTPLYVFFSVLENFDKNPRSAYGRGEGRGRG